MLKLQCAERFPVNPRERLRLIAGTDIAEAKRAWDSRLELADIRRMDRYGPPRGYYVSPAGMSLESRAMNYVPDTPASVYSVEKAITGVERATVMP